MIRKSLLPAFAVLLLTLTTAGPGRTVSAQATDAAEPAVAADQRLPENVYLYFGVPNVTETQARFKETGYGRLWRDESFAEFRKDLETSLKELSGNVEATTGFNVDELLSIPDRGLSVAVVKGSRQVPAVVAFIDFGGKRKLVDAILEKATQRIAERAGERKVVQHNGTSLVVYPLRGEANSDVAFFIKDSTLVVGSDAETLKAVLDRWDGKHDETFARTEIYSYIKKRTKTNGRTPALTWYVDPLGLINAALSSPQAPPEARMATTMLSFIGVGNFKATGGSMDWNVGEYDSLSRTVMYVQQSPTSALNLFQFPETNLAPSDWVRDNAINYQSFNWDVDKAYAAAASLYGLVTFRGQEALDEDVAKWSEQEPNIHLKKDVLDLLTGRVQIVSDYADPKDPATARSYAAVGVNDEKKAAAVLARVAKHPMFPGEATQYKQHTLYEVDLGGLGGVGVQGAAAFSFTVARGGLFLSSSSALLKDVVDGKFTGKPLKEDPVFQRVVAKFPDKTSMMTFERGNAIYDQLRAGALGVLITVDFSKMPEFEKVQQFLLPSGSYTIPDEKGVYSESMTLKPKR